MKTYCKNDCFYEQRPLWLIVHVQFGIGYDCINYYYQHVTYKNVTLSDRTIFLIESIDKRTRLIGQVDRLDAICRPIHL